MRKLRLLGQVAVWQPWYVSFRSVAEWRPTEVDLTARVHVKTNRCEVLTLIYVRKLVSLWMTIFCKRNETTVAHLKLLILARPLNTVYVHLVV